MFRSARLKLTLFYLAILLGFSLVLTVTLRIVAEQEYDRSASAQLTQVRRLLIGFPWQDLEADVPATRPDRALNGIQSNEASAVREHLNRDFASINAFALLFAGLLSYWFAGRTLRPIEEAHRAQARFAADASHELRTPLATMRVENEVFLRTSDFTEAEAREQIESNLEEVQRLENLSNTLLALTHYENVRLPLSGVSIRKLAREAVERAQKAGGDNAPTFDLQIAPGRAMGNYDSLVQLLGILLDNAAKYGPHGGTVTIHGLRQGGQYVLEVIDEGKGIAEADLPHIFERLYRGDKARSTKAGGVGLGLSLAREIVRANQGSISARNAPPKGACFTVRLVATK